VRSLRDKVIGFVREFHIRLKIVRRNSDTFWWSLAQEIVRFDAHC